MRRLALLMWACAAIATIATIATSVGCGGGGRGGLPTGASPIMADVVFHYEAKADQKAQSDGCNGVTRIYPSWWGITHATMVASADGQWAGYFENVPVGKQSVRIAPPPGCENPSLVANAVALTTANDNLIFAFTVHPDGSVTD